jgi:hypothetical protein
MPITRAMALSPDYRCRSPGERETRCQVPRPQLAHLNQWRGLPAAFQRTPPRSQIDRSLRQTSQRAIHARDSASIACAQARGATEVRND